MKMDRVRETASAFTFINVTGVADVLEYYIYISEYLVEQGGTILRDVHILTNMNTGKMRRTWTDT